MGSSTVMMCPFTSLLILSIIAASVVLLPDPVGPVTSTRPRGFSVNLAMIGGSPRSSNVFTLNRICRMTERDTPALLEAVAAEAGQVLDPEGEVQLVFGLEALLLVFREHRVGERQRVFGGQHLVPRRADDVAVHPDLRALPGHNVKVGGVLLDHLLQGARADSPACTGLLHAAAVSFTTSSSVVMPFLTLTIPSMRSVSMPSLTAISRISSVEAPFRIPRRSADESAITS